MGASSNNAEKEAKKAERARQANIAGSTARINSIFDAPSRQAQYADFGNALRDYYRQDLDKQQADASRNLKFSLAKAGLTGGSAAADSGRVLSDDYQKGIINAERKAQAAVSDLQNQDAQARLNLTQLAQQGADATTVGRQAAEQLAASAQNAKNNAFVNGLGDVFGNTAMIYQKQNAADQARKQFAAMQAAYAPRPVAQV